MANSWPQTKRKFTAATAKQYFHPLWIVATTLINMQIEKQALKSRFIAYKDVSNHLPRVDLKLTPMIYRSNQSWT